MSLTTDQRRALLETFRSGPNHVRQFLRDLPEGARHFRPAPHAWTIHEILVHLADSEAQAYIRFRRGIAESGCGVFAYDQDKWTSELGYEHLDAAVHIELFTYLRRSTDALLSALPEEQWQRTVNHPEHGMMTIDDLLVMYADHAEGHVGQMQRTLDAWRKEQNG